jgi:hypothetical protein
VGAFWQDIRDDVGNGAQQSLHQFIIRSVSPKCSALHYGCERGHGMPDEIKRLRQELLFAYQLIRDLTEQVCDLHILVAPLIGALDQEHAGRDLGEARLRVALVMQEQLFQEKSASIGVVEQAIRRLKVN